MALKKRTPRGSAKKAPARRAPVKRAATKKALKAGQIPPQQLKGPQEMVVEESKYYTGPAVQKFEEKKKLEIPRGYGDNRIVLMVRDTHWLYAYWELNEQKIEEVKRELGNRFFSSLLILRVYDARDWGFFDVDVQGYVNNWYINAGRPDTSFCVDIGFLTPDGYFICAARSNVVLTPRDRMSEVIDEEWMVPDWDKLYSLSGGHSRGKGSMETQGWQSPSSWVSSFGSPFRKQPAGNDGRKERKKDPKTKRRTD